ncbi:hypothetical protein CDN99_11585 [Roseateles aquatilis]|uniref:FecR protein domain-containing protein n=2 Tax=Roseateles aquatilis TaxID=431061 RepID=A0A246JEN0_9BURK|nr:hypothetical protein CDN99_11585 [Roseateles aquatilis]
MGAHTATATATATATDTDTDAIAATAADWIVRLSADDADERQAAIEGFEAWKRADPRHLAMAANMERFIDQTRKLANDGNGQASTQAAHAALDEVSPARVARRRRVRRGIGLAAAAVLGGAALLAGSDPGRLLADLRQPLGAPRSTTLADGSTLTLAGGAAVDVRLDGPERHIVLRGGEILLQVAKDPLHPLIVETPQGNIRALGTRFLVRRDGATTWLTMLESRAAVTTSDPTVPRQVIAAGERARITARGIETLPAIDPGLAEEAFRRQRLIAQDRPLAEVLDELAQHRPGLLRYDAKAVAGLRVTAVLPLDDTDRALALVAASFPRLRIRRVGDWLVFVDARA